MGDTIKVSTDDLTACAVQFKNIAESLKSTCDQIASKMGEYDAYWKGSFTKDFDKTISEFKKSSNTAYTSCTELVDFINKAVEKYIQVDRGLIPQSEVGNADYPGNVTVPVTDLKPNMGPYSMKQYDYSYFTQPHGYNAGCCATAYAIGLSIVTGQPVNPTQFWRNGLTYYDQGHVGPYKGFDANTVYEALKNGKPTMLHYHYKRNNGTQGQHWVLIKGIREGADVNNLSYRDFVVIDPASGTEKTLADIANNTRNFNIGGMKNFC